MVLWLTVLLVASYLSLVLHEVSHIIVIWARGGEITSFKPWPHYINERLYFGRVTYTLHLYYRPTPWRHSAPLAKNVIVSTLAGVGAFFWLPAITLVVTEIIDCLWWWRGYFGLFTDDPRPLDGWRYRQACKRAESNDDDA